MSGPLNIRILLRLCILFTFVTCLWLFSNKAISSKIIKAQDGAKFEKQLSITTAQLQPDNGVIPIELKCEAAELSAPNTLEKLICSIKNNTSKYVTAGALYTSITVEQKEKVFSVSSYDTFDTFLHPDFREDHPNNLIPPGGDYRIDELPSSFEDSIVIREIAVRVDYVEFADNTILGPNRGGARIIAESREGAAKYKKWLARKYVESKESMKEIVPLLDRDQPLPEELEIKTSNQEHGAIMYRNFARRTYETKGAAGLSKHLKQTSTSASQ